MPRISKQCLGGFEEFQGLTIDPNQKDSYSVAPNFSADAAASSARRRNGSIIKFVFLYFIKTILAQILNLAIIGCVES
jgi:hypothetical protein